MMTENIIDGIGYCKGIRDEKLARLESKKLTQNNKMTTTKMKKSQSADILERMQMLTKAMTKDTFVKDVDAPLDKEDPDYGRPQEGTRTAARGQKAHKHVHKEILELCEVIYLNGMEQEDHTSVMFFGDLFRLYTRISDKVVGILLRARKYGLVYFESEMLFQGQNDDEPIFLTKPMQEIYLEFNQNKGFILK